MSVVVLLLWRWSEAGRAGGGPRGRTPETETEPGPGHHSLASVDQWAGCDTCAVISVIYRYRDQIALDLGILYTLCPRGLLQMKNICNTFL